MYMTFSKNPDTIITGQVFSFLGKTGFSEINVSTNKQCKILTAKAVLFDLSNILFRFCCGFDLQPVFSSELCVCVHFVLLLCSFLSSFFGQSDVWF